jgi:hypothetical protein
MQQGPDTHPGLVFAGGDERPGTRQDEAGVYSAVFRPYLSATNPRPTTEDLTTIMRPEIQTQLDNAKQSIGLLRRHL